MKHLWNQAFPLGSAGAQKLYNTFGFGGNSLMMQPPQNQIIPKDHLSENNGEKTKNYSQVMTNRKRDSNPLQLGGSLSHTPQVHSQTPTNQSSLPDFQKPL